MISMKRTILIKEVQYSNQAKNTFGMTNMAQVTTTKMVTIHVVSKFTQPLENDYQIGIARVIW